MFGMCNPDENRDIHDECRFEIEKLQARVKELEEKIETDQVFSRSAQAGMAWSDIASTAYAAYSAATGNKNFRGDVMPSWPDLPLAIRLAWEAAVRQAGDCLSLTYVEGEESRWGAWSQKRQEQAEER